MIQAEFRKLQKIFKLQDWDLELIESSTMSSEGTVDIIYNDYQAEITIKSQLSYDEKVKAIIHELIHVVLRNTQQIAKDVVREDDQLRTVFIRETERETEKLSKIIYNALYGGS